MTEVQSLKNYLTKVQCAKCGASLDTAKIAPLTEVPIGVIAHAVCLKCKSENVVTITTLGTGVTPLISDLMTSEVKDFVTSSSISLDDVLNLHKSLKKENVWNLLHKKDKNSEKALTN